MFNLPFPTDSLYKFGFMFGLVLIVYSFYYNDNHLNKFDKSQTFHRLDSLKKRSANIDTLKKEYQESYKAYSLAKETDTPFTAKDTRDWYLGFKTDMSYDTTNTNIRKLFNNILSYSDEDNTKITVLLDRLKVNESNEEIKKQLSRLLPQIANREIQKGVASIINNQPKDAKKQVRDFLARVTARSKNHIFNDASLLFTAISDGLTKDKEDTDIKITDLSGKYTEYYLYFYALLAIGVFLFILGILGWYFRIQKPQDDLLKMQLKEEAKKIGEVNDTKVIDNEPTVIIKTRKHFEPKILPRPEVRNKI
ncbi:hypothetical protein SNE25_23025 [Mucilaginibacter sabulilitoris]|uniref:Uncharacterized protein n=1 Tax=Mucilaginibacter sabulilitoris TaxID=1173583 RepID=A0ABZ0THD0_9SPHI|nr:hypothetical protein [Mucilaginibacter sabulilitoris]WPU92199.1 hypothetical protein SNE25_23025 [Mucilaginibacter sabulilitoris]